MQDALKVVHRVEFLERFFFFLFGLLIERKQISFWKYKLIPASYLSVPSVFGEINENISTCLPSFFATKE